MTRKTIYNKKSDSLWLGVIVVVFLSLLLPLMIYTILSEKSWIGIIVLLPASILYILLIRGLIRFKSIQIENDSIKVSNYWNKKIDFELTLSKVSKILYDIPGRSTPPFGPIKVMAFQNDKEYQFSVKGFYEDDLIKLLDQYNFPIYKKFSDKQKKLMNKKATNTK